MTEYIKNSGPAHLLKGVISQKRRMSKYKAIHETMQLGLKPPWALFNTFMSEAHLIASYKRFGDQFSAEISLICSKFEEAFKENDIEQMVTLYDDLEALKLKSQTSQN